MSKNQAEDKSTISAIKIILEGIYNFFSCSSIEKVLFTVAEPRINTANPQDGSSDDIVPIEISTVVELAGE